MENLPTEENYNRDLNANPNEIVDDEPCPPPGLSRLVTGQTYSFDEGPNSPPFDRVVPGDAEPFQMFPPVAKKTNYANTFANDSTAFATSQDFFDSYLLNSNSPDPDLAANSTKNKFASLYFSSPDAETRETFLQQDASRIPHNAYDGASKNANVAYSNFKSRPPNQPFVGKPSKGVDNAYDSVSQPPLPANRVESVPKFEHNAFVAQHENDQIVDREKASSHLPPNSFAPTDKDRRNETAHNPSSDRMAIEGSCDTASYPKAVPSSTPMQSPNYDFWYNNDRSTTFVDHQDLKSPYDDVRLKRDSNYVGGKYGGDKMANVQNVAPAPSNMHFAQANVLQMPQDGSNMHSKTPSISSNTSSMNEASGYQPDKFMCEQKRIDHYGNSEILDAGNSNYDITANVANKANSERPKNFDVQHSDNDFANDPRQLQKLDLNRETFENNDDDREISHYTDSDERPVGKRTVLGYNNNTIPRARKGVDRPVQDTRTRKQYSYDASHIKGNKMEPPLEQRLVVGETSSDAAVVQNSARTRDDRPYNDEKAKRSGKESLSGRSDKSRKKPSYDRRDRRKIESDDDDFDESIDRPYDDAPGPDSRSYHDSYYRSSPRRFEKRLPRRHPENSFTQSQDESYYDEDDDDDSYSYRGQRKYYDRRPPRESSYRHYYHDQFHHEERKYRRGGPDFYGRYEDDSFYGDRNSRPSSRSGSELFRPSPFASQRYYPKFAGYEYLDHRELIRFGGVSRMKKEEVEYWATVREVNPKKYMVWFKDRFPKQYADWYARFYSENVVPANAYQADRRGSGHSGQSSVNNDTLSVKEDKLLGINEQSMFRPVQSEANSVVQETRCSPSKFPIPHVKGLFNSLGQLIEVNACAPQDGQMAKIDIKKLAEPKDPDWIEFFNFTGPFIPGETHVHTVSQFLRYHADNTSNSSKKLLYFLIDLIIRLRGVADGIAVSELLTASYADSQRTNHLYDRDEDSPPNGDHHTNEAQIVEKYTNLLLQGDKHSALELAVNNKLWGHAFLLASKMGSKYESNVLAKFDASISVNNPLKTLYQLHSNQIPLAATACNDEKWGDWRPHLAMILSNPTSKSDLDKTSIITLGDSLASKDIYAAHFCYLAAEMDFDPPNKVGSKFSLLSWRNHLDDFNVSTPNHAILLTQTYEFAKRLQRKDFTISALLPYKYLLATRLLDYNRSSVALQYLESIAVDLMKNQTADLYDLMYNVLELSERIKYSDSKPLVSDSGDKEWLTNLRDLVDNFSATDQNAYQKPRQLDQLHQVPNFQQTPLTQPLPQMSPSSQQPSLYSPVEEPQPPLMFQPSSISQPAPSLPASLQNSAWDNPSFTQSSLDLAPSGGFMHPPANKSVDINDNISTQPPTDFHQPSNDYQQPVSYSPWDQPQLGSISMHSSNNYFNDGAKPLRHENAVQNRPPESQSAPPTSAQDDDKNGDKKPENGKWLGWLSKITRSNTHVAKLPDDKDPSLIFDPKIGRWVDKDSKGEDNGEKFQPPPMASDFKSVQKVDHEPGPRGNMSFYDQSEPAGAPPASSRPANAYSLRGKGMKAHYVNVLANNKSTVRPPNLPTPPGFSSS